MKSLKCLSLIFIIMLLLTFRLTAEEEVRGVIIGETVLLPGQKAVFVASTCGFPEQMWAMRGKTDKKGDYIKFDFVDYGLTFDITNDENTIRCIIVKKSGNKLKGIPFDVGDPYDKAKKAWGEPDKKEAGYANFFNKGVMLKVTDKGDIELIAIYAPGKIDYDEMNKKQGQS